MEAHRDQPDALLMNFTNPESRMCLAVSRYTDVRFVGLCHGIGMAQTTIGKALDLPPEELLPLAAGLNHFTWVLDLRRKDIPFVMGNFVDIEKAPFDPLAMMKNREGE